MEKKIDGKSAAKQIKEELKIEIQEFNSKTGIQPCLALLLVGENPASEIYVGGKVKASAELGIRSIMKKLPSETSEQEVLSIIDKWNSDPTVHGILVQLPLPKHIDENKIVQAVDPSKDVDGFHPVSTGKLVIGLPTFIPCTPLGIMELLRTNEIGVKGKHVVVAGRSNIVGKPIANLLYQKNPSANAIVTICHTGAPDIFRYTRDADILIAAIGVPDHFKSEHVKEGSVIIDVGINRVEDPSLPKGYRVTGDVDYHSVYDKVSRITPVPGGVGAMTIVMLMKNTLLAAKGSVKI